MRKSLLLLLLSVCSIMVYAQREYESFLNEGKMWRMEYKMVVAEGYLYEDGKYILRGDTVFNGIPFKRLCFKDWIRGEQDEPEKWLSQGFIGEQNGKVYSYASYEKTPNVIMDFTLHVGDTFISPIGAEYIVKAASDTILSNSDDQHPRRCISLALVGRENTISDMWIEGIGSVKGGIMGIGGLVMGAYHKLLRCDDNGVCIYEVEDYQTSIHNITNDENKNIIESKKGHYQLNGLPAIRLGHGVYVKDGRKVIK